MPITLLPVAIPPIAPPMALATKPSPAATRLLRSSKLLSPAYLLAEAWISLQDGLRPSPPVNDRGQREQLAVDLDARFGHDASLVGLAVAIEDFPTLSIVLERIEAIFVDWDDTQRHAVEAYRHGNEDLQEEAIRRLVRALKAEPTALAAMKQAASDEAVYAVLRRHNILKASLTQRVEVALESVRPMLASLGDVELVNVAPPMVEMRFMGACDGCPASILTLHAGVKKAVEEARPEITDIRHVKGSGQASASRVRFVSPFALDAVSGRQKVCRLGDIPQGGAGRETHGRPERYPPSPRRHRVLLPERVRASRHGDRRGEIEGGIITCPYHGFRYDLASGECLTAPEVQLQPHAVRVTGERVEVRLSA